MTWICPDCKKEFRNKNQEHSCARVPIDDHFKNKPGQIRMIFDRLMQEAHQFGDISVNPVKTSIQVKAGATFLSVRTKRDRVEIEFQLGREIAKLPITRSFRISKNRVLHTAVLERFDQVNKELVGWLQESYELISGQNLQT